jgi:hypothetical protein
VVLAQATVWNYSIHGILPSSSIKNSYKLLQRYLGEVNSYWCPGIMR